MANILRTTVRVLTVGAALTVGACASEKPNPDVEVVQVETARQAEEARKADVEKVRKAEREAEAAFKANVPEYQAGFPKIEAIVKDVFPKARADFQKRVDAHVVEAKKLLASEKAKDGQPIPDPGEGPTTYSFDSATLLNDFVQTVLPRDEGDLYGKRAAFTKMSYSSTSAQGPVDVEFFADYSDTSLSSYLYNRIAQALPEYSISLLSEGEANSPLVTKSVRFQFATPESVAGKRYNFSVRSVKVSEYGTGEYALSIDYGVPGGQREMESYYHGFSSATETESASERFDYRNAWDDGLSQTNCTPCPPVEGQDSVPFQMPAHLQPFAQLW